MYLVQHADDAEAEWSKLSAARERELRSTAESTIGHGSPQVRGERDRRDVDLAGAVLR
ncbi:hypothetical protein [Embleya sp. NPDC020886]|uniref:hypothetical protein n=1 Tax=Embleya sp. NPDC020886 TaxID=3363980 RepID=UPI0037B5683E